MASLNRLVDRTNNKWQAKLNEKVILRAIWSELRKMNALLAEGFQLQGRLGDLSKDKTSIYPDADDAN